MPVVDATTGGIPWRLRTQQVAIEQGCVRAIASGKAQGWRLCKCKRGEAFPTPLSQNIQYQKKSRQHLKFIDFAEANTVQACTSAAMRAEVTMMPIIKQFSMPTVPVQVQLNECCEAPILKAKQLQSRIYSGIRILSFSTKAIGSGSTCRSCSSQAFAGLPMNFMNKQDETKFWQTRRRLQQMPAVSAWQHPCHGWTYTLVELIDSGQDYGRPH